MREQRYIEKEALALHASFFLSIMVNLAVQIENAEKAVMYCPNTNSLTHNA